MPFKCDKCDKEFNTQQGLDQHKLDKHGVSRHDKKEMKKQQQEQQKSQTSKKGKTKKMAKYAVVAVVIIAIIGIGYYIVSSLPQNANNNNDILNANLYGHNSLALHIHPNLQIEINGQPYIIPANTGISGSAMRVIHTHDDTGKLHVESPVPHTFLLKDFFTIWGKSFNSSCIFEYCVDDTHTLSFLVNGQPSSLYENLPLKDLDNIKIVYGQKQ